MTREENSVPEGLGEDHGRQQECRALWSWRKAQVLFLL